MGFSKNPELVEKEMSNLLELKAGRACRWRTEPNWPATERLYRRLRQALYIANLYPDRFPELAKASKSFTLHQIEPGVIEARPKQIASVETDTTAQVRTQSGNMVAAGVEVPTVGLTRAVQLIDSWMKHQPMNDPIQFPQTTLSVEELTKLYHWAKNDSGPERAVMVGKGFVVLSLMEKDLPEWTPPQGAQPPIDKSSYDIDSDEA